MLAERAGQLLEALAGVLHERLRQPAQALDLGNSGTSMRLMSGLMAAQNFPTTLVGDESLSRRPMRRIVEPLRQMGAQIETTERNTAPLRIAPAGGLKAIRYASPVASAQVKSGILLAGLYAEGRTEVSEPEATAGASRLTFVLEQNPTQPTFKQQTLGRFRIWATREPQPLEAEASMRMLTQGIAGRNISSRDFNRARTLPRHRVTTTPTKCIRAGPRMRLRPAGRMRRAHPSLGPGQALSALWKRSRTAHSHRPVRS